QCNKLEKSVPVCIVDSYKSSDNSHYEKEIVTNTSL
ncbi:unnamed protein product, partial [marine sediment metagenome]